jgi:hypothetical protein
MLPWSIDPNAGAPAHFRRSGSPQVVVMPMSEFVAMTAGGRRSASPQVVVMPMSAFVGTSPRQSRFSRKLTAARSQFMKGLKTAGQKSKAALKKAANSLNPLKSFRDEWERDPEGMRAFMEYYNMVDPYPSGPSGR